MAKVQVRSEIAGSVWKLLKAPGERVAAEDAVLILESMKMEIPVVAPRGGVLVSFGVAEGEAVSEGQVVAVLEA